MRYKVVHEFKECGNYSAVARKLGIHVRTVIRWVARYRVTGGVDRKSGQGRKRSMAAETAQLAADLLCNDDYGSSQKVAQELFERGLTGGCKPVHPSTVIRHAKAAAVAVGKPIVASNAQPQNELSATTIKKRKQFCNANLGRTWGHVMFTDRKKFLFKYPGTKFRRLAWIRKGTRRVVASPNHPMAVNVYAGITKYGMTKPICVAGTSKMKTSFCNKKGQPARNITSAEYEQVLLQGLLPEGKRLFTLGGHSTWVLQQDNDPTHKKAAATALKAWNDSNPGNTVSMLPNWPPNSPDLSIIENIWAWAQQKVDAAGCKTFEEFKTCIERTLQAVPQQLINKLFQSMKHRMQHCIDLEGDRTKY